ncbi:hypothetical protein, partial [Priestia megaterium]|uniref:hypothetical protein n=1 Tax=Priestia megaterium TaxID=1404 RepID=UPI0012B83D02
MGGEGKGELVWLCDFGKGKEKEMEYVCLLCVTGGRGIGEGGGKLKEKGEFLKSEVFEGVGVELGEGL